MLSRRVREAYPLPGQPFNLESVPALLGVGGAWYPGTLCLGAYTAWQIAQGCVGSPTLGAGIAIQTWREGYLSNLFKGVRFDELPCVAAPSTRWGLSPPGRWPPRCSSSDTVFAYQGLPLGGPGRARDVAPVPRSNLCAPHGVQVQLYAVDHSARASMKSAASCVN